MKTLLLLIFIGAGFFCATAQENNDDQISTIFSKNRKNGGYGALYTGYTQIDSKDAFLMGARGAWIIDHSFAIGLGGCGFMNDWDFHDWRNNDINYNLAGGYGGLYIEPIIAPRLPVHLSFPILVGAGGITQVEDHHDWTFSEEQSDAFFVLEPSVEVEFNLTRHLRLAGSLGYRFTSNIHIFGVSSNVLEGTNIGLIIKFGKF
jgi:hypothetical protein